MQNTLYISACQEQGSILYYAYFTVGVGGSSVGNKPKTVVFKSHHSPLTTFGKLMACIFPFNLLYVMSLEEYVEPKSLLCQALLG